MYLHYGGNASVSQLIPTAAGVTAGLHAETSALTLGGVYTFAPTILGVHYSVAAFLPYLWVVVTAKVATPLGFVKRTNSLSGLGDLALVPGMLAWKYGDWQYDALLSKSLSAAGNRVVFARYQG